MKVRRRAEVQNCCTAIVRTRPCFILLYLKRFSSQGNRLSKSKDGYWLLTLSELSTLTIPGVHSHAEPELALAETDPHEWVADFWQFKEVGGWGRFDVEI